MVCKTMAMFGFLNTRGLEGFGAGLAEDLGRGFLPASQPRTDPGTKHRIKLILEWLAVRAVRYPDQNRLGIFKKAKLANVLKWKLSELGYSDDFVDRATKELATRLASGKAQSKNPSPKLLS